MSKSANESVKKLNRHKTTVECRDSTKRQTPCHGGPCDDKGLAQHAPSDTRSRLVSLLLNLYLCSVYGYSIYFMLFDARGSRFNKIVEAPLQKYTLLRYITVNSLVMQLISAMLHVLALLAPKCKPIRDSVFTSFAFPLSCLVVLTFWTIWFVNGREYIYPVMLEPYVPNWLNQVIHTIILPANLGQAYLTNHRYFRYGAAISMGHLFTYNIYLVYIKLASGMFPYFFMDQMCIASRVIYIGGSFLTTLGFYQLGFCLNRFLHPKARQS